MDAFPNFQADQEVALRGELRAAVERWDTASQDVIAAEALVTAQRQRVVVLQEALQPFADLDARIDAVVLDRLKQGHDDTLPDALEDELAERGRLTDRAFRTARTLDRLVLEAEMAAKLATSAYTAAAVLATRLLSQSQSPRVVALVELESEAARIRSEIVAFAETWLPSGDDGQRQAAPLPPDVVMALREVPANAEVRTTLTQRKYWEELHAALLLDPTVSIERN